MPTKSPKDLTCRLSNGGCGRVVEIVSLPRVFLAMGFLEKTTRTTKAVHEGECLEIPRVKVNAQAFCVHRLKLEEKCKSR